MKVRNLYKLMLVMIFVTMLSSCNNGYGINLYNLEHRVEVYNDMEIKLFENIEEGSVIELPILEEKGLIFIGWTDEVDIYYDEYTVTSSGNLYAVFELVTDVFEYIDYGVYDDDTIMITNYTGIATHLKIPQTIDGSIVASIGSNSFEESSLLEVVIPIDASVSRHAFLNSEMLIEVSFYGDFLIRNYRTISGDELDEIISENPESCVMENGSIELGTWTYEDGCPIERVKKVNGPYIIDDEEYLTYEVLVDKNLYPVKFNARFIDGAFSGATSLETIYLPSDYELWVYTEVFEGCTSLKNIIVDEDNESLKSIDGIVYSKDGSRLIYYPQGLDDPSFEFPNTVTSVSASAFYENVYLGTIIINEIFEDELEVNGLYNLEEFIVDENNEVYSVIDGVLFKGNELVKYPAGKIGASYSIPTGILSIGVFAFENNKYLESIDLGDELIDINGMAFANVEKLTKLDIPASVLYLDWNIIHDSSIETIIINRSIIVDGSITQLSTGFGRLDIENFTIYIPDDSFNAYALYVFWDRYISNFRDLSEYVEE